MKENIKVCDANEAAAHIAYNFSEQVIIYPITPSSPMSENCEEWSSSGIKNLFGNVPMVTIMQSEAGAIGAVHGSLQLGMPTTTFTSSQGLLLMIPNMYKIAGELTPFVMHVAARTVATHALSIFGDHSDVMACRQTGFAMIASSSVQEAQDMALIAHIASNKTRVPFIHFFDGFRTSHEISKIETLDEGKMATLVGDNFNDVNLERALTPENPKVRGTAQNPDVFFQNREAVNPYYAKVKDEVKAALVNFEKTFGRKYEVVEYHGAKDAEKVMVIMASGADAAIETSNYLNKKMGDKTGVLKVRLYRPFPSEELLASLPKTVRAIAVMDRTKEPGSVGEPLYTDVLAAMAEAARSGITVIGGRYGLSSKEFNPKCVKAVFDELAKAEPKNHFTVGINDDVSHTSLPLDAAFHLEQPGVTECMFYGLGSDGTVGANKNSIKIIATNTDLYGQGYFEYDSKKAGSTTISHLRFAPTPIHSSYLIDRPDFIACHNFAHLLRVNVLENAKEGATVLINSPFEVDKLWERLPYEVRATILDKKLKVYAINAIKVAAEAGMGRFINGIMQTCFFKLIEVLPCDEAISCIKCAIEKTYAKKGAEVVAKNCAVVDMALANLHEVVPGEVGGNHLIPLVAPDAPDFIQQVTRILMEGRGNDLPVSVFPADGTWDSGTTKYEKRGTATEIPVWDSEACIQCGKCAFLCPHSAIRIKAYDAGLLKDAPAGFKAADYKGKEFGENQKYTVQVSPLDCTGCTVCVENCPIKKENGKKAINMAPVSEVSGEEETSYKFFDTLPWPEREKLSTLPKHIAMREPLFEFCGACGGCGETAYIRTVTQMFGDRMMVANATGCSSIYGGNLPTTPYTKNADGLGPAWSNSLFEDNAEYGMGMRLAADKYMSNAVNMLTELVADVGELAGDILKNVWEQVSEADCVAMRKKVAELKTKLVGIKKPIAKELAKIADFLVKKSVWIFGGDGWAYDIGYGGLDHVLNSGKNVNILVLDTEVYSNTGGQQSKSTPQGAVAKFANSGKVLPKKDLGMIAMSLGAVYVAQVTLDKPSFVKALVEAESYDGPSLIIANAPCREHGYDLINSTKQQDLAVKSGHWPLYRFDPRKKLNGEAPFMLDSAEPTVDLKDYMMGENRYRVLANKNPEKFEAALKARKEAIAEKFAFFKKLIG